ncbi:ATP phosphoribosyltransferase regulatory subunit [Jannaschia aquimarina]|uniref:HisZ protein n=1 Tax=Jannaschia aquimarina TaxID=935700 RepID=A0A0D1EGV4_9RHOB|nr:ATP phosphoribosyltransferase regulatory subunit [Jannaschia aquimarina]KIT15085.1 ATP phosphoribosyltransferase regulatory subunit [Jannaschia aquimarina]SNS63663.1 ATP phosphoribosyltransferase regulatory subunit [Jannaschia aquimarina]
MIAPDTRARAGRLLDGFLAAGAVRVEPPILLPAGPLLDLYGEDIRARAFTTHDPLRGEAMLRPDFTVPVVLTHLEGSATEAAYAYAGEVFRRQEDDEGRPREYLQVGYERMGGDPAQADAEVLSLIARAVGRAIPATGDLGLLIAAVDSLDTTRARRAALRRHLWRPRRFRRLMERFTATVQRDLPEAACDAPVIGLRSAEEIAARHAALIEDASAPPIPATQADAIEELLDLAAPMQAALSPLRDMAVDLPGLDPAVDRFEARMEALAARGVDVATLPFALAKGRSALEYYDGFTFTFSNGRDVVATGGRYDALTAALGRAVPAVGGVIRPGLLEDAP